MDHGVKACYPAAKPRDVKSVALLRMFFVVLAVAPVGAHTPGVLFPLPDWQGIGETHAILATAATKTGSVVLQGLAAHPGKAG